jgi:hypothetical protein
MAAPTPNRMLAALQAIGKVLMIPAGVLASLGIAIVLFVVGVETVYFFHNRPLDAAGIAAKSGVELSPDARSLAALEHDLGPPTGHVRAPQAQNAIDYWWWHDEAVEATAVGDDVVSVDFGARKQFQILPYHRPAFAGALLGLRLGQAPPTLAEAAALRARAKACCNASVTWDLQDGRIAAVHFRSADYSYQYSSK